MWGPLAEEMRSVERAVTEAGRETYEVPRGDGHHGDTVYALGLAVAAGERLGRRTSNGLQLAARKADRSRPRGKTPRPWNTARRVLEERRREREAVGPGGEAAVEAPGLPGQVVGHDPTSAIGAIPEG